MNKRPIDVGTIKPGRAHDLLDVVLSNSRPVDTQPHREDRNQVLEWIKVTGVLGTG
jgi:hypothetical protein